MLLHCYAVVYDNEERDKLKSLLRHHGTQFHETTSHIAVDMECTSSKTAMKIIEYFESIQSEERGISVIGRESEVRDDTS